jgi:hypothetical protein
MRRFRQDIVRDSGIADYPIEYQILQQHPPIPDPPRTPVKWLRRMPVQANPVRKLASNYLHRMEKRQKNAQNANSNVGSDQYDAGNTLSADDYHRLLGVPVSSPTQAME